MWRIANSSKSCGWRWLPGQHASCSHGRSQGLPGLPHAPVGCSARAGTGRCTRAKGSFLFPIVHGAAGGQRERRAGRLGASQRRWPLLLTPREPTNGTRNTAQPVGEVPSPFPDSCSAHVLDCRISLAHRTPSSSASGTQSLAFYP